MSVWEISKDEGRGVRGEEEGVRIETGEKRESCIAGEVVVRGRRRRGRRRRRRGRSRSVEGYDRVSKIEYFCADLSSPVERRACVTDGRSVDCSVE